jgi:hydrogenase-4 component F
MLAAVQSNCALVVLFRVVGALRGGHEELVSTELIALGLASMAVSTAHIVATRNLERLIAYASINHAGVIAIALGIGRPAAYGLLLYVVSNAFIKAMLFLTAGKIESHYGTKDTRRVSGLIKDLPVSGVFLMVGTFALLGLPPFGSFLGELLVLSALVSTGRLLVFAAFCVLIAMTFVATGRTIFPMIWGQPPQPRTWPRQTVGSAAPKILFVTVLVVLGVYIPRPAGDLLAEVASTLGGTQ